VTLVDIFDSIPTQTGQGCYILNAGYLTEINGKSFQRSGVVFLRFGKAKARLLDGSTVSAMNSRNLYDQFYRAFADRKHLESATVVPEPDDLTRFTGRTPQSIAVNAAVQDRLAVKKVVL
jgi:hypothetical protein